LLLAIVLMLATASELFAVGALFVRPLNSTQTYQTMSIKTYDATAAIQDQIAVTHVDQVFHNGTSSRVESTFIFPLPESAVITELIYWFNGQRYVASLREKKEAQQAYNEKIRKLIDPALLQEIGGNMFKLNIAPIDPNSDVRFEITYAELLPYEFGNVEYRFLLNTTGLSPQPLERVSLKLVATTSSMYRSFTSPSHGSTAANEIIRISPSEYHVNFGDENFIPDKDLVFSFSMKRDNVDFTMLTYVPTPQDSFGLDDFYVLWMTAPDSVADATLPRNIVFAADISSSMEGKRLEQLKEALKAFVESLNTYDRFNIVVFSTGVVSYRPDLVSANEEELGKAREFVAGLGAVGLTNIDAALRTSLRMSFLDTTANIVVFMTDGHPTWGEKDATKIVDSATALNNRSIRIFPFGIGDSVSKTLLNDLAKRNGGYSTYITSDDSISQTVSNYFRRVTQPVLTNLSVDYGGLSTYDRYPDVLPNLFWGSQALQFGRYRNPGTYDIAVSGLLSQRQLVFRNTASFDSVPGGNRAVARLWARYKIDFLLGQIAIYGEQKELVNAVIDLSIRFGILTPYTALYADPNGGTSSDVENGREKLLPRMLTLQQNVPNPFTSSTRINFFIPPGTIVKTTVTVYDLEGRSVRVLYNADAGPGEYSVVWDGCDDSGRIMPAGTYLCRLNAGVSVETCTMMLVR
jgi:Ca-activated chloride channel family protein